MACSINSYSFFKILYFHLRPRNSCRLALARAPAQEARAHWQGRRLPQPGTAAHISPKDRRLDTHRGAGCWRCCQLSVSEETLPGSES